MKRILIHVIFWVEFRISHSFRFVKKSDFECPSAATHYHAHIVTTFSYSAIFRIQLVLFFHSINILVLLLSPRFARIRFLEIVIVPLSRHRLKREKGNGKYVTMKFVYHLRDTDNRNSLSIFVWGYSYRHHVYEWAHFTHSIPCWLIFWIIAVITNASRFIFK